jgi:hypothetical protein
MTPADVAATLLAHVRASGALRAAAMIEEGTVDAYADGSTAFQRAGSPVDEPIDPGEAAGLGLEVRPQPPFRVNAATGEVAAPLGALEHVAEAVQALARTFGGRSVVLVEYATDDDTPFALSAREGEGLVAVIGDDRYSITVSS